MIARKKTPTAPDLRKALRIAISDLTDRATGPWRLKATARPTNGEFLRVSLLLWLFAEDIRKCVARIRAGGSHSFDELRSDSATAHRKAAAIQDLLIYLGYYLGPTESQTRGLYGGPRGKPIRISLGKASALLRQTERTQKLLQAKYFGSTESWTRDAVRRLQVFLGNRNPGLTRPAVGGNCLAFPDGCFGTRTLNAVRAALTDL